MVKIVILLLSRKNELTSCVFYCRLSIQTLSLLADTKILVCNCQVCHTICNLSSKCWIFIGVDYQNGYFVIWIRSYGKSVGCQVSTESQRQLWSILSNYLRSAKPGHHLPMEKSRRRGHRARSDCHLPSVQNAADLFYGKSTWTKEHSCDLVQVLDKTWQLHPSMRRRTSQLLREGKNHREFNSVSSILLNEL